MNTFEKSVREVIEKHGCTFIKMIGECRALWKNKHGYQSIDDVFVLKHMPKSAWEFWGNYKGTLDESPMAYK